MSKAQEEKKLLEDMYTQDTEKLNAEIRILKHAKSASDRKISDPSANQVLTLFLRLSASLSIFAPPLPWLLLIAIKQDHEIHVLKNELLKLTEALERSNDQVTNYKRESDELRAKIQQQSEALLVLRQNEALDLSQQHNAISFLQSGARDRVRHP
jgi:hypothetical protein